MNLGTLEICKKVIQGERKKEFHCLESKSMKGQL